MNNDLLTQRLIFLAVFVVIAVPLFYGYSIKPAKMETAEKTYAVMEKLAEQKKFVLIAADLQPSTQSENEPQIMVLMEHLMRKRIPFGLITITPFATPYMKKLPEDLAKKLNEETGQSWKYGTDWVDFGYRPGQTVMIQKFAKSKDLAEFFKTDASGTAIADLKIMQGVKTIKDISALIEITGLVGVFNSWLQFFRADEHVPLLIHGCTAITIPETYNYFITNQISGLLEGVAGAAAYEELLSANYIERSQGRALRIMTALSFGNILVFVLIFFGNVQEGIKRLCGCNG